MAGGWTTEARVQGDRAARRHRYRSAVPTPGMHGLPPVERTPHGRRVVVEKSAGRCFDAYFAYLVDVLAHAAPVTVLGGAAIVPPVLGGRALGESLAALVAEQLALGAGVEVEFEFESCPEGPLAVTTDVRHTCRFGVITYRYSGTFTSADSGA